MNEILKAIETRRSIRHFKPDMIDKATLEAIIKAGTEAPSGMNRQSAVIVAVTDKETRDRLAKVNAEIMDADRDPFYGAPVILIVLAKKERMTYIYDGSLAMGNLMLAAHSLGVGSCWIHRAKETFEKPEWREWLRELGIGDDYEGIGNCALGYVDGDYPTAPPSRDGRVFWVE